VTKDFLKIERFKQFLETNNLKADPALLSEDYLETLPSQVFLTEGAFELISGLHGKIPVVIITNGIGNVQYKRFSQSGLNPFIEMMIISEECGFSKPDKRIFDYTFDRLREKLKKNPRESKFLMIGDKLETDILGAQNCEIDSCWYNPDKIINSTTIAPTFEIQSLSELLNYL
jgi:YjjG family noncanonical pyrimidine nucleotidase